MAHLRLSRERHGRGGRACPGEKRAEQLGQPAEPSCWRSNQPGAGGESPSTG